MKNFIRSSAAIAIAAGGLMLLPSMANAQERTAGQQPDEIIVYGAPIESYTVGRSHTTGAPIRVYELTRRVSYHDLDLRNPAHVDELEWRIETAAVDACRELDQAHPFGQPDVRGCISKAVDRAEYQMEEAVAASY
jgi:UrcA family protein